MLRQARELDRLDLVHIAVSARTLAELPYAGELFDAGAVIVLTREPNPAGRPAARLETKDVAPLVVSDATPYICGSAGFAEAATEILVDLGVPPGTIRVERFGPTS